jgi:glycine/D-amino acid oxidase-like deaminating enzyme/nitrite reductase/ring-hydroxylating ferredoxin subunit
MRSSERSESVWEVTQPQREYSRAEGLVKTDVCIVGAGLAGMTTAYLLSKEGKRVVVLDDNAVGGGETGQTTAHLVSANDDYFHVLERIHGEDGARLTYQSHHAAIERIAEIVRSEAIDCDYERVDGYWFLSPGDSPDLLSKEFEAARRAGADVQLLDAIPGVPFASGPTLRFGQQGQFHPLKYIDGLARCVQRLGGRICTGSHVTDIQGGRTPKAAGDGFEVRASAVVVCTNSPIVDRVAIHTKQAAYRTFVVAGRVPRGSVPHTLLWDTQDPYHYVRVSPLDADARSEMLIVGGEDHKTGHQDDADRRFAALESWAREHFPQMGAVEQRWSGQVMEPVDYIAFIGHDPGGQDNVYVATGDSGQGMTHTTIAGMLITDLIAGRANPWQQLYEPTRKSLSATAIKEWAEENVDVGIQYVDLIPGAGTDASDTAEIAPGSGAVLQRGAAKVAAYRHVDGTVIERSAFCTHLGCVVHWNSLERSWDCPCHGSRFAPDGEVLNGPAIMPLSAAPPAREG